LKKQECFQINAIEKPEIGEIMAEISLEEVNNRFNEELQRQIDGNLPEGHIYELCRPEAALLAAGVADLPIELSAERLAYKANINYRNKHPFDIAEVKNLPKAINEPIAVFKSTKLNDNSKIILTELKDKNGYNFVASIKVRKGAKGRKNSLDVNSITSTYPKDNVSDLINWIKSGNKLTLWLDKKKALNFVSSQSTLIAGGHKEGLLINIIKKF
jgi:hypothetical protein